MIKNQRSNWQKYKTNTFYTKRKTQHNYKQITVHKVTDLQWVEPQCLVCELTSCVNCGPEIVWKKIKTYYLSSVKNEEHYFKTVWVVVIYMVWCVVSMKRSRHGTAWTCQKTFGWGCSNSVFWAQYLWPKKQVHHTLSKHLESYRKETSLCVYIHLCNTWLEK